MKKLFPVLVSLFLLSTSQAATITVGPARGGNYDFNKIQSGIDAANNGDIVLVAPKEYEITEPITFGGKAITVRSDAGPEQTTIRVAQDYDFSCIVIFDNGEDSNSLLEGFTITGGPERGVSCINSSPRIENCIFTENWESGIQCLSASPIINNCTITGSVGDSGINCRENSSPTITNCTISGNMAQGSGGGGIYCNESSPDIINCIISENQANEGGGVAFLGNSFPKITDCTIQNNHASAGGGIFCIYSSSPVITNCTIHGNFANYEGGGIFCVDNVSITILNSTISGNYTESEAGGLFCDYSTVTLTNTVFTGNSTWYIGAGMLSFNSTITITNCTFNNNSATEDLGGGAFIVSYDPEDYKPVVIANTIFSNNGMFGLCFETYETPIPMLESCLFYNNSESNVLDIVYWDYYDSSSEINSLPGASGNLVGDPLYAFEDDFHLTRGSAAIDSGNDNPTGGLPDTDKDGNPRILAGGRSRWSHVDIGAYEFNNKEPAIASSPSPLEFFGEMNTENPDSQILQIRNCGGETLNWSIEEDCSWLTVDPCSGNSTDNINNVSVSVDTYGMTRGIYTASLSIIDPNASNSPRIVQVFLRIKGTLHVPQDYPSIQNAINSAMEGETIEVASGTYNEAIVINKKVELIGVGKPVIDANGNGYEVVTINADECVLDGFEITGGYMGLGIYGCNNITLRNNIISSNYDTGINIYDSFNNTLINNEIRDNDYRGLYIGYNSNGNVLRQNAISGSVYNFEVEFSSYPSNDPISQYDNDIDISNTVDGKPIYYLLAQDNVTIDSTSNAGCVYLIECTNITVRDLTMSNNGVGILLINTNDSQIDNVTTTSNDRAGIFLVGSTNNELTNNNVSNSELGINLSYSPFNTLKNNACNGNYLNFVCEGDIMSDDYQQDIDTSNTVDGRIIYYLVNQSDVTLDSSSNVGCLYAVACNNIMAQDVDISNTGNGIVFINTTNSLIEKATLTYNSTNGIHFFSCSGCTVRNSEISDNYYYGVLLEESSDILLESCDISSNERGIDCYMSDLDLINCTISSNYRGVTCYTSSFNLTNCIIKNNPSRGIEFTESTGSVANCTIYRNSSNYGGIYARSGSVVTVTNSILWAHANSQLRISGDAVVTTTYCNIQGGYEGNGNIDELPLLTPDGHLCSSSPCIDKGDPIASSAEYDIDGESRGLGGISDIGADEFIDTDSDSLPNFWENKYFDPNIGAESQDDSDNDDHTNLNEYELYSSDPIVPCTVFYVDANRPNDSNDGLSWETAKRSIVAALELAENSDRVIIAPGIYNERVNTPGRLIIIQSTDPTDPAIVDSTILRRYIRIREGESRGCTINGLTISTDYSGSYGIFCENSSPTIENCNIINNRDGVVCRLNSAPMLSNCSIGGNSTHGLYCEDSSPIIQNSIISGNTADMGGGFYCRNSELTINNSLITGNAGLYEATAIYLQESTLNMNQCTVADNLYMEDSPAYSSVIYGQRSILNISNSIIWNNAGSQIRSDYSAVDLSYSDIKGGAQGILGYAENHSNINVEPLFAENGYWTMTPELAPPDVDTYWVEGDYHLKSQGWRWTSFSVHDVNWVQDNVTSRCIDAGNPGSSLANELLTIPVDPTHDFGENNRVNMGAYGGTNQASIPPNNWSLSGDLNNDGTINFIDMAQWSGSSFPEDIDNPADLDRNSIVNMADLMILTQDWLEQTSWF